MYATIRQYDIQLAKTGDVMKSIQGDFLPVISAVPGFLAYEAIDAGERLVTVSTFETQEGAAESTRRAAKYLEEHPDIGRALSARQVTEGEVKVHRAVERVLG